MGVEKPILQELAENSSRQDTLQTIFSDRMDISIAGFEAVCAEDEFFNTHACWQQLSQGPLVRKADFSSKWKVPLEISEH